jgi:esterase
MSSSTSSSTSTTPSTSPSASPTAALVDELFTTEIGDQGPRLVFLHGLFGQGRNWLSAAKALSADFRVLLVDLPNHGRSPWTDHFSYLEMADAVGALLGSEPAAVVGHSMGGKVAMALALRHPERVSRLVVVDVSPVRAGQLGSFDRYVSGMRSLDLAALPDRAAADSGLRAQVPDPVVRGFLLQNLRRDGNGWRWQLNLRLLGDSLDLVADWPDLADATYPGPVLWLAGARSDYVQREYAPAMRRLFPRVQLVTVKNAGHWVHADQPDVFVRTLQRFLHPP